MRKNKTLMYAALGLAAWWYYQKQKGNNIFGQPVALTAAQSAALASSATAAVNAAALPTSVSA